MSALLDFMLRERFLVLAYVKRHFRTVTVNVTECKFSRRSGFLFPDLDENCLNLQKVLLL